MPELSLLELLPDPCLLTVIWFLGQAPDIARLAQASRTLARRLGDDDRTLDGGGNALWRQLLEREIARVKDLRSVEIDERSTDSTFCAQIKHLTMGPPDQANGAEENPVEPVSVSDAKILMAESSAPVNVFNEHTSSAHRFTSAADALSAFGVGAKRTYVELRCGVVFDPEEHHHSLEVTASGMVLRAAHNGKGWASARSLRAVSRGRHRLRLKMVRLMSAGYFVGVASSQYDIRQSRSNNSQRWTLAASGSLCGDGFWASAEGFKTGDTVECVLDLGSEASSQRTISFSVNGKPSLVRGDNIRVLGSDGKVLSIGSPAVLSLPEGMPFFFVFSVYASQSDIIAIV